MEMDLTWAVEVKTCGPRKANAYLEHGYKLIDTAHQAFEKERRDSERPEIAASFIARTFNFVLARSADVPHYEPYEEER